MRVCYQTVEFGDVDIHLRTLRDTNELGDDDGAAEALGVPSSMWGIFGVVWESSKVLAAMMSVIDIEGSRFLEVGSGIGIASLMLNHRRADVTAIDRHPAAQNFLDQNAALNHDPAIPFQCVDWGDTVASLGRFDVIIGSDLLYEHDQSDPLADFIAQHARPSCRVIFVDPGRGGANRFARRMQTHGFSHSIERALDSAITASFAAGPRVRVHTFQRDQPAA
ncbi:MAG: 2-polyprenyl-3-methyl-5-hydroxy-6-metoxy-1,4-benzoquinol methylase [Myxococcota bacterium]|jgi:2-polyprenyl-3-methyl-5-hydroxy-6-metoxy-1,4-benzoquinol methylase